MMHLANYRQCIIGLSVLLSNCNSQNKKKVKKMLNKNKRRVKSLQVNISKTLKVPDSSMLYSCGRKCNRYIFLKLLILI